MSADINKEGQGHLGMIEDLNEDGKMGTVTTFIISALQK